MAEQKLRSLDYMRLIAWMAYYRNGVVLNKTQMQKLLYIVFGVSLADDGEQPIFSDDTPRAWPFGPVFPTAYKCYTENYPQPLSDDEIARFSERVPNLDKIDGLVKSYCHHTSLRLSMWSHEKGSPWFDTVYSDAPGPKWNRPIPLDSIASYFKTDWSKGLR